MRRIRSQVLLKHFNGFPITLRAKTKIFDKADEAPGLGSAHRAFEHLGQGRLLRPPTASGGQWAWARPSSSLSRPRFSLQQDEMLRGQSEANAQAAAQALQECVLATQTSGVRVRGPLRGLSRWPLHPPHKDRRRSEAKSWWVQFAGNWKERCPGAVAAATY